jgi:DNA-binding response OmpR family regulator
VSGVALVIEDDEAIGALVGAYLEQAGFGVVRECNGADALETAAREQLRFVVLDLGLPDVDGTQVLGMIRGISAVPVIVATARDDENEMVRVLDLGADDYVVKPFSAEQLEARLRAVLRRGRTADDPDPALTVGGLSIDRSTRVVTLDGRPLDLTRMEFDLLAYLAGRAGRVVSKRQLMAEVWQQPYGGADKTVDVHLSWLRRKLGETAAEPRFLLTVRGVGVKLIDPDADT